MDQAEIDRWHRESQPASRETWDAPEIQNGSEGSFLPPGMSKRTKKVRH